MGLKPKAPKMTKAIADRVRIKANIQLKKKGGK